MGECALFELDRRDIFLRARVLVEQTVEAFALSEGIELLDEGPVPRAAAVLFAPIFGQDDVGYVEDVKQIAVFLGRELDLHGRFLIAVIGNRKHLFLYFNMA